MTLRHADFPSGSVGSYGTNVSLLTNGIYASIGIAVTIVDDPDPNITGNVLRCGPTTINTQRWRWAYPSVQTVAGTGVRVYFSGLPISASDIFYPIEFTDINNATIATVEVLSNGSIRLNYTGGSTTTAGPVLSANAWQHIEARIAIDASTGQFEVRVDGTSVLALTNINTGTASVAQVATRTDGAGGSTVVLNLKDLTAWDGQGSINNSFLGNTRVVELPLTADASFNWATSSGGTGFNLINESPPDDDASYISAGLPLPAASTFQFADLDPEVTAIRGLLIRHRSRNVDAGDGNIQTGFVSGMSSSLGVSRPMTTSHTYYQDVYEVDPATSVAWTRAGVNSALVQEDRTV